MLRFAPYLLAIIVLIAAFFAGRATQTPFATLIARIKWPALHVVIAVLGVATGFFVGRAYPYDQKNFDDVAAAWVQAIGSVIAILIAIWVDRAAGRRAEKQSQGQEIKRLQVARFVSHQLLEAIGAAETAMALPGKPTFDMENFASVSKALEEIPLIDLYTGKSAISVINQRRVVFFYKRHYDAWCQSAQRREDAYERAAELRGQGRTEDSPEVQGWIAQAGLFQEQLDLKAKELGKLAAGAKNSHKELEEEVIALAGPQPNHIGV